ncbi:MAG: AarF/UbiB family protein [Acidobacteriota bacterium]
MRFLSYVARALRVMWIAVFHLLAHRWVSFTNGQGPTGPERMRMALEQMSGSFLKFGQILSLQVDTLPREYCDALLDLLDRVPPFSSQSVKKIIEEELGSPPEELYAEFDYSPLAAASIGQVHRAVLKDGTRVAVKVQRPGIRGIFTRDAVLLNAFVKLVFALRLKTLYFMRDPVREFNEWIQDELDYRIEADYARMLGKNAAQTPTEKVPQICWDLTTERVLTMDFLEGQSVREYLRNRDQGATEELSALRRIRFDPPVFVSNVIRNFVSDALRFGVFHADLHPANLLILEDNRVGYVDFGIVGQLTPEARRKIIQMTLGYVRGENDEIFSSFMAVSEITPDADLEGFRRELEKLSRRWYREPPVAGRPQFGRSLTILMIDLLTMCRSFGVLPRREMIKYIRSLFLADGLVSRLAPGLDYGPHLRELCEEYVMEEAERKMFSPRAGLPVLADAIGWLQTGPGGVLRALDLLERGELPLRVKLAGSESGGTATRGIFWVVVGWLAVIVTLLAHWDTISRAPWSAPGMLVWGLAGLLTGWLLAILWRLTR